MLPDPSQLQDGDHIRWNEDTQSFIPVPASQVGNVRMQSSGEEGQIMTRGTDSHSVNPSGNTLADLTAQFNALDERIDDKQDKNANTDALHNGTIPNETFLFMESGDINGKTPQQIVDILKPLLDALYA